MAKDGRFEGDLSILAENREWLRLIHHEEKLFGDKSTIDTQAFYLDASGREDPKAELAATITAFLNQPPMQCRFPARVLWLKKTLPNLSLPETTCSDYEAYLDVFKADSISVIYASGYLGNPASMFGHLLLKLNTANSNDLLDNTFSYGADIPPRDNKFTYIQKGITGGYQGRFSNQKYHHQNLAYTESEMRDMWEYQLNLSQEQVDFILAHLWELSSVGFTYYFFDENCAYQIAKLLELVIDAPLTAKGKIWVTPIDIVEKINSVDNVVLDVIYHESRQEKLYRLYKQLNAAENDLVFELIEQPIDEIEKLLETVEEDSRKRVIDVMYDYYAFIEQKNKRWTLEELNKRQTLLLQRFKLSPSQTQWEEVSKVPPHFATKTSKFYLSSVYNGSYGHGFLLNFRASYYDLLNINSARVPFSELIAFDASVVYSYDKQEWNFREFDLININNLNVSRTDLDQDESKVWGVSLGYKPVSFNCFDCSDIYAKGLVGKSTSFLDRSAFYMAAMGELQFPSLFSVEALIGVETGVVFDIAPYWVSNLQLNSTFNLAENGNFENWLLWEQRFLSNRSFDVRTRVAYNEAWEYSLGFSVYW